MFREVEPIPCREFRSLKPSVCERAHALNPGRRAPAGQARLTNSANLRFPSQNRIWGQWPSQLDRILLKDGPRFGGFSPLAKRSENNAEQRDGIPQASIASEDCAD